VSGLQNEPNIACPKKNLTTVFMVQSTDPPIKNGVIILGRRVKQSLKRCNSA